MNLAQCDMIDNNGSPPVAKPKEEVEEEAMKREKAAAVAANVARPPQRSAILGRSGFSRAALEFECVRARILRPACARLCIMVFNFSPR